MSTLDIRGFADEAALGGLEAVQGPHTRERYLQVARTRVYEHAVVPGPLQVKGYCQELMEFWGPHLAGDDGRAQVAVAVTAHLERSAILAEPQRRLEVIIEERVLLTTVGGSDLMTAQLGHLLGMSGEPNVTLAVIPQDAARNVIPSCGFFLFTGQDGSQEGAMETPVASVLASSPAWTAQLEETWRRLGELAVHGRRARGLVIAALERAAL